MRRAAASNLNSEIPPPNHVYKQNASTQRDNKVPFTQAFLALRFLLNLGLGYLKTAPLQDKLLLLNTFTRPLKLISSLVGREQDWLMSLNHKDNHKRPCKNPNFQHASQANQRNLSCFYRLCADTQSPKADNPYDVPQTMQKCGKSWKITLLFSGNWLPTRSLQGSQAALRQNMRTMAWRSPRAPTHDSPRTES